VGKVVTLRTPIRFCTSLDTISTIDGPKYLPLPAYVQLFHENGDIRQCDPLPLYSETEDSNPAPPASSLADCVAAASAYTPRYPSPADLPEYENEINAAAAFAPGVGADVEGVSDGETVPTIVESTSRNEQGKAGVRSPAPPLRPKETDGRRASVAATVLRTRAQLA